MDIRGVSSSESSSTPASHLKEESQDVTGLMRNIWVAKKSAVASNRSYQRGSEDPRVSQVFHNTI